MRICLIATKLYPDHVGGKAVYTYNYYRELKKKGHDVYVLTGLWNKKIKDPNIIQLKIIRKRYLWILSFFIFSIKHLILNSYDVIHTVGVRESIITYLLFKKFIATVHDAGSFQVNVNIVKKFYPRIISRADRIIVPSKTTKIVLKQYMPNINNNKIFPVLNGVDLEKFIPLNRELALKLKTKLGLKGRVILYMGIIKTYKGVEDIISAFQRIGTEIDNVNLIIAGGPSERMEKKYSDWKKKYPNVVFTGRVPDKQVPLYYALADIFVTYSWTGEGFGLTAVEAMASGVPVICSDLQVYREVLKDKAILIPSKNDKILAKTLMDLLKNENKMNKLSIEGRKYIEQYYNWEKSINNLIKVYKSLKK